MCPGSVREEAQYQDIAGEAAIDGTGSHELLELCLKNNVRAESYIDQIIAVNHHDMPGGWFIHADRATRVQMCLDYVSRRVRELGVQFPDAIIKVESETRADPGGYFGRTDWWGTVDITITVTRKNECLFIEVCDYKDGRGYVHVPYNTQLVSYLSGKMRPWVGSGPDKVRPFNSHLVKGSRISVVQPKTRVPVRYEDMAPSEVMAHAENLGRAAHRTDEPDAPLIAGKHCQWCKANPKRGGHCTAEQTETLAKVETMSTDVRASDGQSLFEIVGEAIADPSTLTAEKLTELADAKAGMIAIFDKVDEEIQRRIEADPESVPGFSMMPGNDKQVFSVDEKADFGSD